MLEQNILCHRCGNVFRLAMDGADTAERISCPSCGGTDTRILPSWVPLGSTLNETTREWEYECQGCLRKFRLPVPDSPSRERGIHCPYCENGHIHRLTASGYEPLYCG